jgi:hypothetical protein
LHVETVQRALQQAALATHSYYGELWCACQLSALGAHRD